MNGNKDVQNLGINDNRAHPDDEYEDDGSGIEDDAPESFQAMVVTEPPWATFPDLLRVPTSINNNIAEDDSPESLSFAAAQSFRSNESSSGYRSTAANPSNQASSSNTNAPIRSSSSRNRPSFTHPDVSQTEQSNVPSASSQPGSSSTTPVEPSGTASSSSSRSFLPNNSIFNASSRYPSNSNQPDHANRIAHHPHRSSINSLNLSSALCSSSYSFHPPSSSASLSSSLNISLAPIASALAQVQSSVDALSKQVNERLDALEGRINNLDRTSSSLNHSSCISADSNAANSETKSSREIHPESLKVFIKEQRKEMHNERRAFLLSFAEALRNAAESVTQPEPSTSGLNGPKF